MGDYLSNVATSGINTAYQSVFDSLTTIGRAGIHALAPDNFEYYGCSLELLDSNGNIVGLIDFAVMPNNIVETKTTMMQITKTAAAVVSTFNPTFTPIDISIQGTFGRKIRILLGMYDPQYEKKGVVKNIASGNFGINFMEGSVMVKTGYGLIKLLKNIVDKSHTVDDQQKPYFLIWNNYAFNTSYVVEVIQSSYNQTVENNMIWYYNLEMKAVALASEIRRADNKTFLTRVGASAIANSITTAIYSANRSLKQF